MSFDIDDEEIVLLGRTISSVTFCNMKSEKMCLIRFTQFSCVVVFVTTQVKFPQQFLDAQHLL